MQNSKEVEVLEEKKASSSKKEQKFKTIFFQWRDILKTLKAPEKKLLRHYLVTVESLTQEGFFKAWPQVVPSEKFKKIGKNTHSELRRAHDRIGTLKVTRGEQNRALYGFPDHYPRNMKQWLTVPQGYLKIEREELLKLLDELTDNELRVYFVLKRVFEAKGSPDTGVETWPKVLRESHLSISQMTLKSCIKNLNEKGYVTTRDPDCEESRRKHRFVFSVKKISSKKESQKIDTRFHEFLGENGQSPENLAHLNKNKTQEGIYINQGSREKEKTTSNKNKESDFNFYGLDRLDRPLVKKDLKQIQKESGLSVDMIQESVMRFTRYLDADPRFKKSILNPVGFLRHHMRTFKAIYIEPEWFLEGKKNPLDEKEREKRDQQNQTARNTETSTFKTPEKFDLANHQISSYFSELLGGLEEGAA